MFNPKRTPMTDYSNNNSDRHKTSIIKFLKQHSCNDNDKFLLKQCFKTDIKTEMESKIRLGIYRKRVNQHLNEHNYFLTDKNIVDYNRNINQSLKDHNYCLLDENDSFVNDENKHNSHFIDHNYDLPVSQENQLPAQQLEHKNVTVDQPLHPQKIATTYSTLPGVRLNSQVYMDNLHHRYYKHSNQNKRVYLVCINQKNKERFCPVTASISSNKNDNGIKVSGNHNHLPQPVDVPMMFLRSAIGFQATRSESMSKSTRQLYNQETVINPEGAKNYTLVQSQLRIRRMRRLRQQSNRL